MKFSEWLHKMGIVRGGSYSWKGSAKDRPIEAIMDDVYDKKKDLVNKDDIKKANVSGKKPSNKKTLFWVMVALGALSLFLILSGGFSVLFWLWLLIWVGYLYLLRKNYLLSNAMTFSKALTIGIVLIVFSFFSLAFIPSEQDGMNSSDSSSSSSSAKLSKKDDGRIIDVQSEDGKLKGKIELELRKNKKTDKDYLSAHYFLMINDSLPPNGTCGTNKSGGCDGRPSYEYVNNLVILEEGIDAEGDLSTAYCNEDMIPESPANVDTYEIYSGKACGLNLSTLPASTTFYAMFSKSFASVEELLTANTFELFDSSTFWETEDKGGGESSMTTNDDRVVKEGKKVLN